MGIKFGLGNTAFLIGLVLTLLMGLIPTVNATTYVKYIVILTAIVVGLLNISGRESQKAIFVIMAMGLVGLSSLSTAFLGVEYLGEYLASFTELLGWYFTLISAVYITKAFMTTVAN